MKETIAVLVDANIYLDLYREPKVEELLPQLLKFPGLLVTRQIVDEVTRQRPNAAKERWLRSTSLKFECGDAPDLLAKLVPGLKEHATAFREAAKKLRASLDAATRKLADGADPTSAALAKRFADAAEHSRRELVRARQRKERGNPPGKRNQSLGDQITWEQFLTYVEEEEPTRVVVVSHDGDYEVKGEGEEPVLNALLIADLERAAPQCRYEFYKGLGEAVDALKDALGDDAASEEKIEAAKKAEKEAEKEASLLEQFGVVTVLPSFLSSDQGVFRYRNLRTHLPGSFVVTTLAPPAPSSGEDPEDPMYYFKAP